MTAFVVDISNWQGDVDMAPWLGAGIEGCIAKALEGLTGVDAKWQANKAKLLRWGGVPGAYHYINNVHPAGQQCDAFLDLVPANWIHALDAEAPGPLDVDGWFKAYRRRYPHKVVWLYTNFGMWRQVSKIPDMDVPAKYGPVVMWVAGVKPGIYQPGSDDFRKIWSRVPAGSDGGLPFLGFKTYAAMQFSGSASVPGVPAPCDMSVFGGTAAELRAYTTQSGEVDMPITDDDAVKIARAVHNQQLFGDTLPDGKTPYTIGKALHDIARATDDPVQLTADGVKAVAQAVVALEGAGPGGSLTTGDVEAAVRRVVAGSRIVADTPTTT